MPRAGCGSAGARRSRDPGGASAYAARLLHSAHPARGLAMAQTSPELELFVREALLRGQSRDAIRQALAAAGWSEDQTRGVLDGYADVAFPVPVPKPRASLSAREAFQYLVLF